MTYFILFHDNSTREITEDQYAQFIESAFASETGIQLGDSFIKHSSYKQIMSDEDFYKQYPNKRPVVYENKFDKYESIERRALSKDKWIKGIIKGIKQHIAEQGEFASQSSKDLLAKWEKKLTL